MRKIQPIMALTLLLLILSCAKTYRSDLITTKVRFEPIDEFIAGEFVVLAFENPNIKGAEDWELEFWAFRGGAKDRTFKFHPRIVAGQRTFYLVEEIPRRRPETIASFRAKPNYGRVKERLTAFIVGGE